MTKRKSIVLGLHPQGLAILKELGKAGADVTACCKSKKILVITVGTGKNPLRYD